MEVRELQDRAERFVQDHHLEAATVIRILDLVSEVGEVAKEALESSDYGRGTYEPTPSLREELGDAFFSLVCVANTAGVDLEACFTQALEKYDARLKERGVAGSER
jgi:NTP pyrophosphatase (non-canonical NTP hydrolase)